MHLRDPSDAGPVRDLQAVPFRDVQRHWSEGHGVLYEAAARSMSRRRSCRGLKLYAFVLCGLCMLYTLIWLLDKLLLSMLLFLLYMNKVCWVTELPQLTNPLCATL